MVKHLPTPRIYHLLDELGQKRVPPVDGLLQRQGKFESGRRLLVTLDGIQPDGVIALALEIQEEHATAQSVRFGFRHCQDVSGDPLQQAAGQKHFSAREVGALGRPQFVLETLGKPGYRGLETLVFRASVHVVRPIWKQRKAVGAMASK